MSILLNMVIRSLYISGFRGRLASTEWRFVGIFLLLPYDFFLLFPFLPLDRILCMLATMTGLLTHVLVSSRNYINCIIMRGL